MDDNDDNEDGNEDDNIDDNEDYNEDYNEDNYFGTQFHLPSQVFDKSRTLCSRLGAAPGTQQCDTTTSILLQNIHPLW